jgi:uncharacterized membrane protein
MMSPRLSIALLVVLVLSLAVNFFGLGFLVVGAAHPSDSRIAHFAAIAALGRAPGPLRHRVEEELHANRGAIRDAIQAVRDARRGVRGAMRAEPFDQARLDGAFAMLRQRVDRMQELVHAAVGRAVAAAPAAERRQIAPPRRGD